MVVLATLVHDSSLLADANPVSAPCLVHDIVPWTHRTATMWGTLARRYAGPSPLAWESPPDPGPPSVTA